MKRPLALAIRGGSDSGYIDMIWRYVKLSIALTALVLSVSACGLLGCGANASNSGAFGGCAVHSSF